MRHIQSQAFPLCQMCRKIEPLWEFVKWCQASGHLKEWTELEQKLRSDFPRLKVQSACMVIYVIDHCVIIVSPLPPRQVSREDLCCPRYSAEGQRRGGRGLTYLFSLLCCLFNPLKSGAKHLCSFYSRVRRSPASRRWTLGLVPSR